MATVDQEDMRRRTVVVALAGILSSGCLEMEQTVTIAPDGGGRQVVKMAMSESTLAEVQRSAQAAQLGGTPDPAAVFDKDAVGRELREAGMTLVSHAAKRGAGRRTVELEASFADFAALQKSPLCGSAAEWVLAAGPREGTAKLTLYPQGKKAWTDARAKADAMEGHADPVAQDFFAKRRQALAGLDVVVRFDLPGDVLVWTRNLEKTGARQVTARITGSQIQTPADLVRRLAPRFEVIFDATGCKLPVN